MRQGQQNPSDSSTNFFWVIVIIIGTGLIVWWFEKQYIVTGLFYIRIYEIFGVQTVMQVVNDLARVLHLPPVDLSSLTDALNYMSTAGWKEVGFDNVIELSDTVGNWLKYPFAFITAILALFLYFRHSGNAFRKVFNMQTLRNSEYKLWPQITPVVKLDLVNTPLHKGPWAVAKLPLDYCKEHNLIRVETQKSKLVWTIIPSSAQRIFIMQLGPLWRGLNALPIHLQALLVIFLARTHKDSKVADDLMDQIAASSASGKLNFSGVREQLRKYQNSRILAWVIPRHAYVGTVMARLLEIGRSDGVLAAAEFLWLKPLDRRMWYMLNSVGRQTPVIEVAGLFSHWLAEKKLGCALRVPTIKMAIEALDEDIKQTLYIAEGETWQQLINNAA